MFHTDVSNPHCAGFLLLVAVKLGIDEYIILFYSSILSFPSPDFFRAVLQEKSCPGRIVPRPYRPGGDTRFRRNIVVQISLLLIGIVLLTLTTGVLYQRWYRRQIEADYNFLLRFYVSYVAFDSETGPSDDERANARLSYKRVINAKLHLTRQEPPIWASLEQYFGPVWP